MYYSYLKTIKTSKDISQNTNFDLKYPALELLKRMFFIFPYKLQIHAFILKDRAFKFFIHRG